MRATRHEAEDGKCPSENGTLSEEDSEGPDLERDFRLTRTVAPGAIARDDHFRKLQMSNLNSLVTRTKFSKMIYGMPSRFLGRESDENKGPIA